MQPSRHSLHRSSKRSERSASAHLTTTSAWRAATRRHLRVADTCLAVDADVICLNSAAAVRRRRQPRPSKPPKAPASATLLVECAPRILQRVTLGTPHVVFVEAEGDASSGAARQRHPTRPILDAGHVMAARAGRYFAGRQPHGLARKRGPPSGRVLA